MATLYFINVKHDALGRLRRITGPDRLVVQEKARLQLAAWDRQWQKVLEARDEEREREIQDRQEKKEQSVNRTEEARESLQEIEEILARTLRVDNRIDWKAMKDRAQFSKDKPSPPTPLPIPREPQQQDARFGYGEFRGTHASFFTKLFSSRYAHEQRIGENLFLSAHAAWKKEAESISQKNREAQDAFARAIAGWERERAEFLPAQKKQHEQIDALSKANKNGDPRAIQDYCELVLSNSQYPEWFTPAFETEYNPANKTLIVDYQLPSLEKLPRLKEVRYVQSRDEFDEIKITENVATKLYDNLVYQIALRSLHELFEADNVEALDSIAFNGWVESIDRGTGQPIRPCILSLHTRKPEFLKINLAEVDPKACFKSLKGVSAATLHSLTPIAPIMQMDRTDRRFVEAHGVAGSLDEGTNLAAISWEDFEHLIRELFEKEFTSTGGEVKITQASRDGGVDAVAFDPDPIRGGKIVIQAKRYTNTVGVSAVRDLYGTVMNEGATKGILVTTSDYGPDAYSFAKGKPLTLLNGSNLLHLLEKHGHRARIDLREAKKASQE